MTPKIVQLPFDAVDRISDLAESPPAAHEVEDYKGPLPRRGVRKLREPIVTELKKKMRADSQSYFVRLHLDDAATLSGWCRAVALVSPADATMLRAAADTIDGAT